MKRTILIIPSLLAALVLASCASVISKEVRAQASSVRFAEAKSDIPKYKDSVFLWGGTIVETRPVPDGTMIEIVQKPVDNYGYITDDDFSEGRFLAFYKGHLDPLIYRKKRDITVAGKLTGVEERKIGDITYVYPVLEVKELYLWKEGRYDYYPYPQFYYPYPYMQYAPWTYPFPYPYPYPYPY